ncbi:MAG: hypothetical protein IJH04_08135 [Eggerthellaceae bacterium]|nr:hypothetical protein [Eggerthellaceae bacterium]
MDKDKLIDDAIDAGGDVAGALVGAGVGAVVAGLPGAVGGAAVGSAAGSVFKRVAGDIHARYLSKGESKRVDAVFDEAMREIERRLRQGDNARDDGFFDCEAGDRSTAEEILEGTLLAAQREYEEKKLPYMAKLYANIAFDSGVSRPMANRLIKIASDLTYRQLVIIRIIGMLQIQATILDIRVKKAYGSISGLTEVSIASDIYDLYKSSLVFSSEAMLDAAGVNPSKLTLGGYGALVYNLMELESMELDDDAADVMRLLVENFQG